jgi:ABC-type transport system substrate-binding protein
MKNRFTLAVLLAVACALVVPTLAHSAGTLRIAQNTSDLRSMDPHFATTTEDRSLVDMIFNGLVRYKPGDGSVFEPDLATSLPTSKMEGG